MKKSVPASSAKWVRMKAGHVVVRLRSGASAWRCRDIANRLIGNHIPKIGQSAHNPVIAPVAVLAGHANDQLLDFSGNPRSARTSTSF